MRAISAAAAIAWFTSSCAPPSASASNQPTPNHPPQQSLASPAPPPAPAPASPDAQRSGGPRTTAAGFVAALNAGDRARIAAFTTPSCLQGSCKDLSDQAPRKFTLQIAEKPIANARRAIVATDAVCGGRRVCDRVYLLLSADCAPAGGNWVVAVATERKRLLDPWIAEQLPACGDCAECNE